MPPRPGRSPACSRWWPRPWPAAPPGSPRARPRRTTATRGARCRHAWRIWPSCATSSSPCAEGGRGVVALLPGGVMSHQEVFALQREIGRPFTWTALLTVKDYPYHEKVIAEHDAAWAEGIEVWPQVSCRPLVFQMNLSEPFTLNMRPSFAALMGQSQAQRTAAYRDPVLAGAGVGGRERVGGSDPGQLGQHFGGPLGVTSRALRPAAGGPGRGEGLHAARRHARHFARGRPRDPVLVRAGQQRSRGDRLAPAAGQRAVRAGRLGGPRLPAL